MSQRLEKIKAHPPQPVEVIRPTLTSKEKGVELYIPVNDERQAVHIAEQKTPPFHTEATIIDPYQRYIESVTPGSTAILFPFGHYDHMYQALKAARISGGYDGREIQRQSINIASLMHSAIIAPGIDHSPQNVWVTDRLIEAQEHVLVRLPDGLIIMKRFDTDGNGAIFVYSFDPNPWGLPVPVESARADRAEDLNNMFMIPFQIQQVTPVDRTADQRKLSVMFFPDRAKLYDVYYEVVDDSKNTPAEDGEQVLRVVHKIATEKPLEDVREDWKFREVIQQLITQSVGLGADSSLNPSDIPSRILTNNFRSVIKMLDLSLRRPDF